MIKSLRTTASLVLVLAVGLLTSACPPKSAPQTTPGGKVAYEAGRVLEAVKEVQKLVIELEAQKVIPTDKAGTVMIAAYTAGEKGEELADIAAAYDLATGAGNTAEAGRLAPRIEGLLTTISKAFPQVDLGPNAAKVGTLVEQVLAAVQKTRAAVIELSALPATTPPATKPPPPPQAAILTFPCAA